MARNREFDEEFNQTGAEEEQEQFDQDAYYDDAYDEQAYDDYDAAYDEENAYDDDAAYDGEYEDEYDDEYDDEGEYDEENEGEDEDDGPRAGFLSTLWGKILVGVIAVLVVVIIVLLVLRFVGGGKKTQDPVNDAPQTQITEQLPAEPEIQTPVQTPGAVVFAPVAQATQEPTAEPVVTASPIPVVTATPVPTNTPEPTPTELPIILSNTPTPSPTPTATPTPSPSPTPTPSPKPTPTPRVDLGTAETNREAKLRESASGSAKVKKTIRKGEALTIHEAAVDKDGKIWYFVSVDDLDTQGWMRDYVMNVDGEIKIPTPTPKPTETPKADQAQTGANQTPAPENAQASAGIGTGKTNRDANVRKIMNGKVVTQLRKGKAVTILDAKLDKNGDLWYEIQVNDSSAKGFVRDYLITLDKGVKIAKPTPTPKATSAADAAAAAELLDREVVGKATTNRKANVRVKPAANASIALQAAKNTELLILDRYTDGKNSWYEVATTDGAAHGFVRDYVIDVSEIKDGLEEKSYGESTGVKTEEASTVSSKYRYSGNKNSMVFHEVTCDLLDSSSKNLVYMESREYAVSKGYKPCGTCNP